MDTILVVNSGSSSLKFQVFGIARSATLKRLVKGQLDGIGTQPRMRVKGSDDAVLIDQTHAPEAVGDVSAAIGVAAAWLKETQNLQPIAVGHRVVHGGPDYGGPVLVDDQVLANLARLTSLAPLHQPHNLAPIGTLLARFPKIPQVACFDTAFHRGHDPIVDHYAIPERFYAQGVRRYGFHGLSYEYVAERLREVAPGAANGRAIIAHLGSGASMCAVFEGRSVDSTLGFTALDGLPMGTRPGQLDPGVVLHLLSEEGMTVAEVQNLLYRECGLKGLSGSSNDVRWLETSNEPRAALALNHFVYRGRIARRNDGGSPGRGRCLCLHRRDR
jgi:acetate kinase